MAILMAIGYSAVSWIFRPRIAIAIIAGLLQSLLGYCNLCWAIATLLGYSDFCWAISEK